MNKRSEKLGALLALSALCSGQESTWPSFAESEKAREENRKECYICHKKHNRGNKFCSITCENIYYKRKG
jgi:hypothetical protein